VWCVCVRGAPLPYVGVAWSVLGIFPECTPAPPTPIDDHTANGGGPEGRRPGRGRAWAGPPRPLLRVASLWLGLGCGGAVGWPRFGPLVGFCHSSWHYAFLISAFLMYSTCIWCIFLQSVNSSSTSGIWLVAKVYVCRNI
jgi:hypothetical protein